MVPQLSLLALFWLQDKGNEKETREKLEKLVDAQQMQADSSKNF